MWKHILLAWMQIIIVSKGDVRKEKEKNAAVVFSPFLLVSLHTHLATLNGHWNLATPNFTNQHKCFKDQTPSFWNGQHPSDLMDFWNPFSTHCVYEPIHVQLLREPVSPQVFTLSPGLNLRHWVFEASEPKSLNLVCGSDGRLWWDSSHVTSPNLWISALWPCFTKTKHKLSTQWLLLSHAHRPRYCVLKWSVVTWLYNVTCFQTLGSLALPKG